MRSVHVLIAWSRRCGSMTLSRRMSRSILLVARPCALDPPVPLLATMVLELEELRTSGMLLSVLRLHDVQLLMLLLLVLLLEHVGRGRLVLLMFAHQVVRRRDASRPPLAREA